MRRPNRPTRCQSRPEALELRCCLSAVTAHGSEHAETVDGTGGEINSGGSGGPVGEAVGEAISDVGRGAGEESAAATGAEASAEAVHRTLGSVRFSTAQANGTGLLQVELGAEFHAVLWQNALGESLTPSGHAQWRLAIPPGSQRLALTAQDLAGGRWTWQVDVNATGAILGVTFAPVDNVEGGLVQDGVPAALNGLDHAHADLTTPLVAEQLRQNTRSHSPHDSWFANTDWDTTDDMTSAGHDISASHNLPLTLASSGFAHDGGAAHGNSSGTGSDAEHFGEGEFGAFELAGEGPLADSADALGNAANSAQLPLDYWNLPYPLVLHPETPSHPASENAHEDDLWEEEAWGESLTATSVDAWAASDEPWESDELVPPRDYVQVAHTSTTPLTSSFVSGETDGDVVLGLSDEESDEERASSISAPGLVAAGSLLLAIQLECWADKCRRRPALSLTEQPRSTAGLEGRRLLQ